MRRVLSSCSLSLEAVKHGHTISAVGVEPCTGRLYFSGGGGKEGPKRPNLGFGPTNSQKPYTKNDYTMQDHVTVDAEDPLQEI